MRAGSDADVYAVSYADAVANSTSFAVTYADACLYPFGLPCADPLAVGQSVTYAYPECDRARRELPAAP